MHNSNNNANSFKRDIIHPQDHCELDMSVILAGPEELKRLLKATFNERDAISDSMRTCLNSIKDSRLERVLDLLLSPF